MVAAAEELVGHGFSTVVLRRVLCGGQNHELRSGERNQGREEGGAGLKSGSVACLAAWRRPRRLLAVEVAIGAPLPSTELLRGEGR